MFFPLLCNPFQIQSLLQNDLVPHGWTAVSRYQEVIEDFLATYDEEDPVTRFVVLINCGSSEDVGSLLGLAQRPNICVVIVDSHRPIMHLSNDGDTSSQIFVLMDSEAEGIAPDDIPYAYDSEAEDSEDDGDHDNDSEQENDDENERSGRRRRLEDGAYVPDQEHDFPRTNRASRRRERKLREDARAAYYSQGVHYGKPSACLLYDLAFHLQQDSSYMLWLALVGLTDHLVHGRVDGSKYDEYYLRYESHVAAGGHLDEPQAVEPVDGDGGTGSPPAPTCRIAPQDDFRFGLLREWTLWDAMAHSPYVASRLQTYTEKGRERLEFLLIKMGIPLREARGLYALDMKPLYKAKLEEQLALHGVSYGLGDAIFNSFQLQDGYSRCVMTVDVVHAATALLESGAVRRPREGSAGSTSTEDDAPNALGDHRDRFWRCWNALSWRDDDGELRRGIELAKKVQRALVADGGSVVVQRLYHNFRQFRIFDLSDHQLTNRALLAHPMTLQRMAAFFQEQHLHQSQNNRRKPLVLIGTKDPLTGRCLVVGYQVTAPGQGNRLGAAFEAAAEEVGAQAWHDLFDTSIMEIAGEDVERFKAELLRVASELL
jgi:cell division control protein 45